MSKDKIADYDGATAGNNTDIGGISIDEGMLPSTVNNSMRELTRQLGAFADGTDGIDVLNLHDDDASASIKIQAPATVTTTTTFTLPDGDGTSGYALVTNGSGQLSWASAAGIGNVVEDSSPQLGGDLQSNGHDIVIADTDNIYVGTSNDGLKIHHSNNNSFIEDVGTGNLLITTNGNNIQLMKNQAEQMLVAKTDGAVELYHDNTKKVETTSTGVSVTGQVIATKGSTGTLATFTDGVATNFTMKTDGNSVGTFGTEAGSTQLAFMVANTEAARFDQNRNLLVGKTALGTANDGLQVKPAGELVVTRDGNHSFILNRKSSDGNIALFQKDGTTVGSIKAGNGDLLIGTGEVNLRFFDTTPAVIPRTASDGTSNTVVDLGNVSNSFKDLYSQRVKGAAGHTGEVHFTGSHDIRFVTNGNERARFDSSGVFAVGKTADDVGTAGVSIGGAGFIRAVRNEVCLVLNRL